MVKLYCRPIVRTIWVLVLATPCATSHAAAQATAGLTEVWSVGSADDADTALTFVWKAARTPEGYLAVFQWGTPSVWLFDDRGLLVRRLGRRGGGPGEFTQPTHGGVIDDSFWVADVQSGITVFDKQYRPVRKVSFSTLIGDGRVASPQWLSSGGWVISTLSATAQMAAAEHSRIDPVLRSGVDRRPSDTIAVTRETRSAITLAVSDVFISTVNPVSWSSKLDVSNDGRFLLVVDQNEMGGHAAVTISVIATATSDTIRSDTMDLPLAGLSDALVRSWADAVYERNPSYRERFTPARLRAAYADAMEGVTSIPPVVGARLGLDDTIWLELFTGDATHRWQVRTANLDLIGDVRLAANEDLLLSSRERIWVSAVDALDIVKLRRYKVQWDSNGR